jgi:transposase
MKSERPFHLQLCSVAHYAVKSIKGPVLGRKNYLFMGADSGGQRAAALYTLIATAKLNDLDPTLYLRTILARLPEHPINQITQLLPWNVPASLRSDSAKAA